MATLPAIFIKDVTVTEGNSGIKLANFTVSLSQLGTQTVTVQYNTSDLTALAGLDYNSKSGTLTFKPGETAKTIAIEIKGDTSFAPQELFNVKLSNQKNATMGDNLGIGKITNDDSAPNSLNYGEALQKSLLFYEAQRSGDLPDNNRIPWRGDSALNDGSTVGVDLTGGYYDAGDYIKFGFPMAASMTMLGWGVVEYRTAYENSGQLDEVLNTIKWGTDYILKAHITENGATKEFWGQVGDPNYEHNNYWGPAEGINWNRPAYKLDAQKPGSDLAAESAAALAAASVAFSETDAVYAEELLENAKQLFEFADTYRGKYSDSIPKAASFYGSGGGQYPYYDELVWGAIWLYQATNDNTYLTKAETLYQEMESLIGGLGKWTQTWGDKNYGAAVLLAEITGKQEYKNDVEGWLNYWTDKSGTGIKYTPGGLAWLTQWGSLRSSANTAFLAGVYSDNVNDYNNRYSDFAQEQIDYILGDNPKKFSYIIGNGDYFPLKPHHSGSDGGSWSTINRSEPNKNIIYGALVGGPAAPNDYDYKDLRTDYVRNEVAIDYNAALTGALIRLYSEPAIFIKDVTVTEGNSGIKLANFTVSLSQSSIQTVTVQYDTSDVTALAGLDYNSKSGILTFKPGETAKTIAIEIKGDTSFAPQEVFNVKLSNSVKATIGDNLGVGKITNDDSAATSFNYGEALQKSLLFYEAQRAGDLPDDNRLEWRGDSTLNDGSTVNVDLAGGYYDAGDHIKFGLPMAASMTMLGWGVIEYQTAYENSGQLDEVLNTIKWGTDYILKAHITENGATKEFWGQVGDPNYEHNNYWGSAEGINWNRPAYKITPSKPGSDLAAESAASLAAASVIFSDTDPVYADELLENAKQLFEFADTYRGKYSDSIPKAASFYGSGGGQYPYYDELVWGAIWLYQATNDNTYLTKAETLYQEMESLIGGLGKWTQTWGDKNYGAAVLLAEITGKQEYKNDVEGWLNYWTDKSGTGIKYTPGGLAWLTEWGSLRTSANTAFLAGVYSDNVNDYNNRYSDFAKEQIDYILGDNPRNFSYIVGNGDYFPLKPHHSGSDGGGWDTINRSEPNKNIIYGALVAGPASPNDYDYKDLRTDYIRNEVALDSNAAFTGVLARLYSQFGGNPLTDAQLDALPGIVINNF